MLLLIFYDNIFIVINIICEFIIINYIIKLVTCSQVYKLRFIIDFPCLPNREIVPSGTLRSKITIV